jgi:hypothetical protein
LKYLVDKYDVKVWNYFQHDIFYLLYSFILLDLIVYEIHISQHYTYISQHLTALTWRAEIHGQRSSSALWNAWWLPSKNYYLSQKKRLF